MLNFIKGYVKPFFLFYIYFYTSLIIIYLLLKMIDYLFNDLFIFDMDIFYRVIPKAIFLSVSYIILGKLWSFFWIDEER